MAKYRKKPIVIEAHQWHKNGDHPDDGPSTREGLIVRHFARPDFTSNMVCPDCDGAYQLHGWIDTLEDGHRVCPGDWIIKGVKGEFYPCKSDIFAATYEKVDEGTPLIHNRVMMDGQTLDERIIRTVNKAGRLGDIVLGDGCIDPKA